MHLAILKVYRHTPGFCCYDEVVQTSHIRWLKGSPALHRRFRVSQQNCTCCVTVVDTLDLCPMLVCMMLASKEQNILDFKSELKHHNY